MPEYLAPGVYMEEIEIGAKPIEGVSTTTTGIIGKCDRGPSYPKLVTSFADYCRFYGSHTDAGEGNQLPYAVQGFFANGGKRCYVARIHGSDCKEAKVEEGITFLASSKGSWGNRIAIERCKASLDVGEELKNNFKLKVYFFSDDNKTKKAKEIGEGPDLNSLNAEVVTKQKQVVIAEKALEDEKKEDPGNKAEIKGKESARNKAKEELQQAETKLEKARNESNPEELLRARRNIFNPVEEYDNLSLDSKSRNFIENRINGISNFLKVKCSKDTNFDVDKNGKILWLIGGADNKEAVGIKEYRGDANKEPKERMGLAGLKDIQGISLICSPDEPLVEGLTDALVDFCEESQRCFAILQSDNTYTVQDQRPKRDSQYSAHYYPWISVMDPVENRIKAIAPCGHVAGFYANTDIAQGVHKAPANNVLRDCCGLQFPVNEREQGILNPRGVNCIRAFEGRGIRIWGARTTSSDASWKYVNVRRLFIFLKSSIERGTQWVVFEPNNHRLWGRVLQSVSNFLLTQWRMGALMGRKQEEAFFVKCDETTMTQDDIKNGRLIVLVGVAPVIPAEFVVFRIAQVRSGAEITEL